MKYDVEAVANELMLTTEDLKEIFEFYFEEAMESIASCSIANREGDYITMAKTMHSLKGSSMNLRMHEMGTMAIEMESLADKKESAEITLYLSKFEDKLNILKDEIDAFYNRLI